MIKVNVGDILSFDIFANCEPLVKIVFSFQYKDMEPIEGHFFSWHLKETKYLDFNQEMHSKYKIEKSWEQIDATVSKIRLSPGYPISSYKYLVEEVANVTLSNKHYEMFYRGQSLDYHDKKGKTVIYPAICRPERKEDGTYKTLIRKSLIKSRFENLENLKRLYPKKRFHTELDEFYYSLFQHYNVLPTPLIDITQSLRVAATFALKKASTGFLYVFGLPYPNGSISHYVDQQISLVKLQNVTPVNALRPRYQEGYLVGKLPIRPTKEGGDNLARRLIAKFHLDNSKNSFWDRNFSEMHDDILFPKDDQFEQWLSKLKKKFLESAQ